MDGFAAPASNAIKSGTVQRKTPAVVEITPINNGELGALQESERKKSLKRLGNCEVCAVKEARYTCPKCEVKTCSVPCVQIHKRELACDGKRDRTKFVELRNMSEQEFRSDYYFLEECTRFTADCKRDPSKQYTNQQRELPRFMKRMKNVAKERKINLLFLLRNFTRHIENTTYYDWKSCRFYWRVEWIFTNAGDLKCVDRRCDEEMPLVLLLDKYLNPQSDEALPERKALEYYQSVGIAGIKLFLKAEWVKRSQCRYYELDAAKSLRENLAGKTIVEFPSIHLTYEKQSTFFEIIDSDEDVEAELKSYNDHLNKLKVNGRKQEADVDSKHVKRKRTVANIEKLSSFLFTDDNILDELSSSSSDTEHEEKKAKGL